MRVLVSLLCAIGIQGCTASLLIGAPAGEAEFDHVNPVVLNEHATASIRAGDINTAWILLERAARLAPHDERIAANLAVVRDWRRGSIR